MGNPKAFLHIARKEAGYRPLLERVADFGEVEQTLNSEDRQLQASRCMDCGIPFCHWGCPVGSRIPEWQDLLWKGRWREASELLHATNPFPEFTGRVCPAPCEKSCVLNREHTPVTIRENEVAIVERAFAEGYIVPKPPQLRKREKVAVVGSGPAGLSVAWRLNRLGYRVTVFEKHAAPGGLLRYGIPDFKLNKSVIDRRLALMEAEGIRFVNGTEVGVTLPVEKLLSDFDAICLAVGAETPRDLPIEGRELSGVHFALDFLQQQNRRVAGEPIVEPEITAKGKHVLVIGGGDTGSDCVGTSVRQGAASVTQIEILPKPPEGENPDTPWPYWPQVLKSSSSHEEGCERRWSLASKAFVGNAKRQVTGVEVVEVAFTKGADGRMQMAESGQRETLKADLVLLAMGFVHVRHEGLVQMLEVATDSRGNIAVDANGQTSNPKLFAVGDAASGASLVVRAIAGGLQTATAMDGFLSHSRKG